MLQNGSRGHCGSLWELGEVERGSQDEELDANGWTFPGACVTQEAHCFFFVCGRKSWSGTRGSLGLWSSLPIGLMTANHLLQSMRTSPSSE